MQTANRYYKCSKISILKFRYLLRLFALDLTPSDTGRLTGLSVRAVNDIYLRLRQRLGQRCRVPAELGGALELDKFYFGPRRVRGKRSRGAGSKTIIFGLFQRAGRVYTEIVPDCSKPTLQGIIRVKIDPAAMVNTDGWRGYDGLVDVSYDRHYRVLHSRDKYVQGAARTSDSNGRPNGIVVVEPVSVFTSWTALSARARVAGLADGTTGLAVSRLGAVGTELAAGAAGSVGRSG